MDIKWALNRVYDSAMISAIVITVSDVVDRNFRMSGLYIPMTWRNYAKLTGAVSASTIFVKWSQSKGYLPNEPIKPAIHAAVLMANGNSPGEAIAMTGISHVANRLGLND